MRSLFVEQNCYRAFDSKVWAIFVLRFFFPDFPKDVTEFVCKELLLFLKKNNFFGEKKKFRGKKFVFPKITVTTGKTPVRERG